LRLAKYIAQAGVCSRRAASRLIDAGEAFVNGEVANHLTFVTEQDTIIVAGEAITLSAQRIYIAYHKPVGIDCNFNSDDPTSLINHIANDGPHRLFAVGRLDKDSSGLLLLTNDGECCHRLLSPLYKQAKRYIVNVRPSFERIAANDAALNSQFVSALSGGVLIDGQVTLPCQVSLLSENCFEIILTQGLNRQIRKMALSQGFIVTALQRVTFANISLDDLSTGEQRALFKDEIDEILCLCGLANSL